MKNSDFRFFYNDGQYFCSVKIPRYTTIYMAMGQDNRPFDVIIEDIRLAYNMLVEDYVGDAYTKEVHIAIELPKLLGYKRATSSIKVA